MYFVSPDFAQNDRPGRGSPCMQSFSLWRATATHFESCLMIMMLFFQIYVRLYIIRKSHPDLDPPKKLVCPAGPSPKTLGPWLLSESPNNVVSWTPGPCLILGPGPSWDPGPKAGPGPGPKPGPRLELGCSRKVFSNVMPST